MMAGLLKMRALRFLVSRELSREDSEEGRVLLSDIDDAIEGLVLDKMSVEPFVRSEQERPVYEGVPKDNQIFECARCGGVVAMATDPGAVPFPVCAACRTGEEKE